MTKIIIPEINKKKVIEDISQFIRTKTDELGYGMGGVIGLSGGVDSTLAASLANEAYKNTNKNLLGLIIPSQINLDEDTSLGIEIAEKLGIEYRIADISGQVEELKKTIPELENDKYNLGNSISRLRANVLHSVSGLEDRMIVGTGNKIEDQVLGYYTLFGDGAVHISPIGDLTKTQVRGLVKDFGFNNYERVASAGLEPGQTDEKDLGFSYTFAELVMYGLQQGISNLNKNNQILGEFESMNSTKFNNPALAIEDIMYRQKNAEKKANLVSPQVFKLTEKHFVN